jgi:membrane protein YqaA with SNARE-associated domain
MPAWFHSLLDVFSLPEVGLTTIFVAAFVGATIVPMTSEPFVLAYVTLERTMFWPAVGVATVGNVLGGLTCFWLGWIGRKAVDPEHHERLKRWFGHLGPPAMAFSFLPVVGDPLCVVGGWLKLDVWKSVFWMTVGKFGRYVALTWLGLMGIDFAKLIPFG